VRSGQRARYVKDHGTPDLVDAVKHGDVKVAAAAEFAKQNPPLDQRRLIAEYGSPVAAVQATVKAKADRAVSKIPRPVADPKPAADRAEANSLASQRRLAAEGVMKTLDFFERENFEPCERAEKIIEHFDRSIAETIGTREFSVTRVRRAIEAMTIVFAAITADGQVRRSA
jgi:hypothetical protein